MKAITRRGLIKANKELRKEVLDLKGKILTEQVEANQRVGYAMNEVEKARERMRRAGLSGQYEYIGGIFSGTVEASCTIDPVDIAGRVEVPYPIKDARDVMAGYNETPPALEVARDIMASQIGKALIENGLIMVENRGFDPLSGMQQLYVQLSVVPWDAMARKCNFAKPGAWNMQNDKLTLGGYTKTGGNSPQFAAEVVTTKCKNDGQNAKVEFVARDMKCGKCGAYVHREDKFCHECGARFRERYDI